MRSLSIRFPDQRPVWVSLLPHVCNMLCTSHPSWFYDTNMWGGEPSIFFSPIISSLLGPNIFLITLLSTPLTHVLPLMHHHHWLYSHGWALASSSLCARVHKYLVHGHHDD
jgi:hypothetical protein